LTTGQVSIGIDRGTMSVATQTTSRNTWDAVAAWTDEILALNLGRVVVRDRPDVVLHDPRVVASYLGTSDVSTTRSGTAGLLAEAPQGD
jgi:hypothetical protein